MTTRLIDVSPERGRLHLIFITKDGEWVFQAPFLLQGDEPYEQILARFKDAWAVASNEMRKHEEDTA